MRAYASEDEALDDVLRLSRAMSYKAALADVSVGGAKMVIIGDRQHAKTEALLLAAGRFIESFGGAYISAPDVGITTEDLRVFRRESRWVVGADETAGPSAPYTALGVFEGVKAAVRHRLGRDGDDLGGLRVAIQGVGSVGLRLAGLLAAAGAHLVVADIDAQATGEVAAQHGADVVPVDEILSADVDVLSPNALGGILNDRTIPDLRAEIICGAANNQLAEDRHGDVLHERGVLFAPDYVVSAGGLIAGIEELHGFNAERTSRRVSAIGTTLAQVFAAADADQVSPSAAAATLARERIAAWRGHDPEIVPSLSSPSA